MQLADRAPASVIIPCYCCQGTLGRALASVQAQTWPPAEVIVVDDGSPDDVSAEISGIVAASRVLPIRCIRLARNGGPAAARNAAWEIATQPLVAFLDADDSWHPRKLEIQARYMLDHPEVVLCGHRWRVTDETEMGSITVPEKVPALPITFRRLLISNILATPTVMVRRDVPLRFDGRKRFSEDYLLWLLLLARGYRATFLDADLAFGHKAAYGSAGLSGDLWRMELGELETYRQVHESGWISTAELFLLSAWSVLKFLRRVVLVGIRRSWQRLWWIPT